MLTDLVWNIIALGIRSVFTVPYDRICTFSSDRCQWDTGRRWAIGQFDEEVDDRGNTSERGRIIRSKIPFSINGDGSKRRWWASWLHGQHCYTMVTSVTGLCIQDPISIPLQYWKRARSSGSIPVEEERNEDLIARPVEGVVERADECFRRERIPLATSQSHLSSSRTISRNEQMIWQDGQPVVSFLARDRSAASPQRSKWVNQLVCHRWSADSTLSER